MLSTTRRMARTLALEAAEFFDGLAEARKAPKPTELIAAAKYADKVANQLCKLASAIEAEAQAKREARRAKRQQKWRTDEHGVMVRQTV
jgi:hypothetical protein